jgi:hypothetical protein
VKFTKAKEVFCETCNHQREADEMSEDPLNMQIFPTDYMKKKRLYIVRNLEEINQSEYENDEEESKKKGKGKKEHENSQFSSPKKKDAEESVQPKEIEFDKWKPYYFDFFNRVGNLTVLSLRKEVNQLIDIISKDSSANGAASIQAYLQQYQSSSSKQSVAGSNLIGELRKYLDLFNDYATIRIYWKFYKDPQQTVPVEQPREPRKLQRTYFLYLNKSKMIIELKKNDLATVMEYCSSMIRKNTLV